MTNRRIHGAAHESHIKPRAKDPLTISFVGASRKEYDGRRSKEHDDEGCLDVGNAGDRHHMGGAADRNHHRVCGQ